MVFQLLARRFAPLAFKMMTPMCTPSTSKAIFPSLVTKRTAITFIPKRTKYRVRFTGRVRIPVGGSIRGTTLSQGQYGIRVLRECKLTTNCLLSISEAVRRQMRAVKGCKLYFRLFSDIGVGVKGNEARMGKGKGPFDHFVARARVGKVICEIGGGDLSRDVAKSILKRASVRIPSPCEFVDRNSPPRLGNSLVPRIPAPATGKAATATLAQELGLHTGYSNTGKRLTSEVASDLARRSEALKAEGALARATKPLKSSARVAASA